MKAAIIFPIIFLCICLLYALFLNHHGVCSLPLRGLYEEECQMKAITVVGLVSSVALSAVTFQRQTHQGKHSR